MGLTAEEREVRKAAWLALLALGHTLQSIADSSGVTRERVRQVVGPDSPRSTKLRQAALESALRMLPNGSAADISSFAGFKTPQTKKLRALGWTPPARPDMEHGASRYQMRGCRCEVCRGAVRERSRAWRERHAGMPAPEHLHGKASTYSNYGCRCEPCRLAAREAQERYRVKRKEKATTMRVVESFKPGTRPVRHDDFGNMEVGDGS